MIFSDPKSDKKMNDRKFKETEAQKANESSKVDDKKFKIVRVPQRGTHILPAGGNKQTIK